MHPYIVHPSQKAVMEVYLNLLTTSCGTRANKNPKIKRDHAKPAVITNFSNTRSDFYKQNFT